VTSDWLPAAAAIVGTAAGGTATYLAARWRSQGNVRTSDADVVFRASESIRHDLTAQLKDVQAELATVKAELAEVKAALIRLEAR